MHTTFKQSYKNLSLSVLAMLGALLFGAFVVLLPTTRAHAQDAGAPADSGVPANQPDPALQQQQPTTPDQSTPVDVVTVAAVTGGEDTTAGSVTPSDSGDQTLVVSETPAVDASNETQVQALLSSTDNPSGQDQDSIVNDSAAEALPDLPSDEVNKEDAAQQNEIDQSGSSLDDSLQNQQPGDDSQAQSPVRSPATDQTSADQSSDTDINSDPSVDSGSLDQILPTDQQLVQ